MVLCLLFIVCILPVAAGAGLDVSGELVKQSCYSCGSDPSYKGPECNLTITLRNTGNTSLPIDEIHVVWGGLNYVIAYSGGHLSVPRGTLVVNTGSKSKILAPGETLKESIRTGSETPKVMDTWGAKQMRAMLAPTQTKDSDNIGFGSFTIGVPVQKVSNPTNPWEELSKTRDEFSSSSGIDNSDSPKEQSKSLEISVYSGGSSSDVYQTWVPYDEETIPYNTTGRSYHLDFTSKG